MKQFMPRSIKNVLRFIYFRIVWFFYFFDCISDRDVLIPPKLLIFVGGGNFRKIGAEFFRYFKEFAGLEPHEKILDVGCGIGRIALPLTRYLDKNGCYEGFDVVKPGIQWCMNRITKRHANFSFRFVDLYNRNYNPQGKYRASDFKFPYNGQSFDFVFLISVFTHMLPEEMENYFSEIARVLKKGGRCFITFFLINKESLGCIAAKKSFVEFKYDFDNYWAIDDKVPEATVAYDEMFVRGMFMKNGLQIRTPILFGSWCGRENFLSYQDVIIAAKQ